MSKEFTPDADDQLPEKKSSQQLLLLLLLLLILLFVYLYFFTGLIKPRGEAPKPPAPVEAPVKKPLPPRPEAKGGEAAKPAAPAAAAQEKKAPAQPGKPGAPEAAKPAAAGKQAPAQEVAATKPGAKAPAASAQAAKAAAGKETAAKPAANGKEAAAKPAGAAKEAGKPAVAAKPAAAKGAQPAKEQKTAAVAEKKGAAKPEAKTAAKAGAAEKPAAAAAKKVPAVARVGAYALEINGDLAESEVTSATAKLKQAGIAHVVKTKSQKGEPMHRLFLADFANRDEALEELERLKLAAPDAFMLKENGRYAVYAGSYMREAKAASEQNRLQAKGVQLLPKTATLPVAVYKLRAGAFADQAAADRAAKTLKKHGLTASVVKTAKGK